MTWSRVHDPAGVGVGLGGLEELAGPARAGVQPAEPALARLHREVVTDAGVELDEVVADLDLAVIGGEGQHGAPRAASDSSSATRWSTQRSSLS